MVAELYGCSSRHLHTVYVYQRVLGRTLWKGDVEVFAITGHARAHRCFAWIDWRSRRGKRVRFIVLLESGFLKTAADAVKFFCIARSAPLVEKFSHWAEPGQLKQNPEFYAP